MNDLPFYCRRRLPADARGRELYDNRESCLLDYYSPEGAALQDDAYEAAGWAEGRGAPGDALAPRPAPPALDSLPHRVIDDGDWTVSWRPGAEAFGVAGALPAGERDGGSPDRIDGWRVEVWEETHDLWKHRLLRLDLATGERTFAVSRDLLRAGSRFAVVLFCARRPWLVGCDLDDRALAARARRSAPPLQRHAAARPASRLSRRGVLPANESFVLRWSIPEPTVTQVQARVRLLEDACLADEVTPLLDLDLDGAEASACRCRIPAALLRSGHTYAWYVDARDADGTVELRTVRGRLRRGVTGGPDAGRRHETARP